MKAKTVSKAASKQRVLFFFVVTAFVLLVVMIPLPFKPSPFSYFYERLLRKHFLTYTTPVYLPSEERIHDLGTFPEWKDSYFVRLRAQQGQDAIFYFQFSKNGLFPDTAQGPPDEDMQAYREAVNTVCPEHYSGILLCETTGSPKLYIAKLDLGDTVLLVDVTNRVFNRDKLDYSKHPLPYDYLPPKEEVMKNTAETLLSTKPLALNEAVEYFTSKF